MKNETDNQSAARDAGQEIHFSGYMIDLTGICQVAGKQKLLTAFVKDEAEYQDEIINATSERESEHATGEFDHDFDLLVNDFRSFELEIKACFGGSGESVEIEVDDFDSLESAREQAIDEIAEEAR